MNATATQLHARLAVLAGEAEYSNDHAAAGQPKWPTATPPLRQWPSNPLAQHGVALSLHARTECLPARRLTRQCRGLTAPFGARSCLQLLSGVRPEGGSPWGRSLPLARASLACLAEQIGARRRRLRLLCLPACALCSLVC
eukprot:359054-Chlamydomonas_euryale.AAC.5